MIGRPFGKTLVAAFLILMASGCVPVVWLPDSSGFIFTDDSHFRRLNHYDLAKGTTRVLIPQMSARTPCPALSPDGKQIAVACLNAPRDLAQPETLQVIIYDREGREVQRSADFLWAKDRRARHKAVEHPLTGSYWGATGGRLLIQDYEEPGNSSKTGIYDLATKSLRVLDGWPLVFGGTPFRPDGKGFLLSREREGTPTPTVFFVDWDGKEQPIQMPNETLDSEEKQSVLLFPWTGTSAWQGNSAVVSYGRFRIRIDVEKGLGTYERLPVAESTVDGKAILQRYAFPEGGVSLRVRLDETEPTRQNPMVLHLELVKAGEATRLLRTVAGGRFVLSPSPNGQWVAIRLVAELKKGEVETILLVNGRGEVREVTSGQ